MWRNWLFNLALEAVKLANKDIAVCPGCAKIGGITLDTLREGAFIPKNAPDVTRVFLEADKIIEVKASVRTGLSKSRLFFVLYSQQVS